MYILMKEGVYDHGVFAIDEELDVLAEYAADMAERDKDNYHNWVVYKFLHQVDSTKDAEHEFVCAFRKGSGKGVEKATEKTTRHREYKFK